MRRNTVPELIDALRPTLPAIAAWAAVSVGLARTWQQGVYSPNALARARLVHHARQHAKEVLALADAVEREGTTQHGGQ